MTPWAVACQAPLSIVFSRQEYCSGLPFPSPGDLPHPGIELRFPALQADSLPTEQPGKPKRIIQQIPLAVYFTYGYIYVSGGLGGKASVCNVGDPGSIPGLGRSPGEENGNPFQHSCLGNSMDG